MDREKNIAGHFPPSSVESCSHFLVLTVLSEVNAWLGFALACLTKDLFLSFAFCFDC